MLVGAVAASFSGGPLLFVIPRISYEQSKGDRLKSAAPRGCYTGQSRQQSSVHSQDAHGKQGGYDLR